MATAAGRVLAHRVNVYGAVEVTDAASQGGRGRGPAPDAAAFEADLWHSLREWRRAGHKGVWLRVHPTAAELVPVAVRAGFSFHRADPECLTLTAWLAPQVENKLPPGPSHFIGVAGFVLNSRREVLCIREKSGPSARLPDFWKLPGGLVDQHEDIRTAVVREVAEETGLAAEFLHLATIQEMHHVSKMAGPARTGTTDLYCICVLRAKDEAQQLVPQASEIAACQWMPLDEFLSLRYNSREGTIYHKMYRAAARVALGHADGLEGEHLPFGLVEGSNTLYSSKL